MATDEGFAGFAVGVHALLSIHGVGLNFVLCCSRIWVQVGRGRRRLKLSTDCYSWPALFIIRCRMGCTSTLANDSPSGLDGGVGAADVGG